MLSKCLAVSSIAILIVAAAPMPIASHARVIAPPVETK